LIIKYDFKNNTVEKVKSVQSNNLPSKFGDEMTCNINEYYYVLDSSSFDLNQKFILVVNQYIFNKPYKTQEAQYKRLLCFETYSELLKEFEEDVNNIVEWDYTCPSNFKDLKNEFDESDTAFITTNLGERQYYVFKL
jgi:hypothetical protein